MRLFLAVDLDPFVKQALGDVRDHLAHAASAGRFTHEDNFHITLAFLGDVPPSRIPAIRKSMDSVHCSPFSITLRDLGCFHRQGGDIWWMGLQASPELLSLADQLSNALQQQGFLLEDRHFSPHVTLGRQVRLPKDFRGFIPNVLHQTVSEFCLMQSERINGTLTYTPVLKKTLK
ncbi:MAG: RNA 2',3'-cyclic phosphodiesterase [Oscillospiraceae bacterium]|jgi:2'-5' RNA ligase